MRRFRRADLATLEQLQLRFLAMLDDGHVPYAGGIVAMDMLSVVIAEADAAPAERPVAVRASRRRAA